MTIIRQLRETINQPPAGHTPELQLRVNRGSTVYSPAAFAVHLSGSLRFQRRTFHTRLPGSPSPSLQTLRPRDSVVGEPRAGAPTGSPRGLTASVRRGSVSRNYFLDSLCLLDYVRFLFSPKRRDECVWVGSFCPEWSGRWFLGMRGGCTKNVYFCFGEKDNCIKSLYGIHVYFCLPTPKSSFQQNQALDLKKCLLLYTFDYLSRWAGTGFVLNQRVDRHGCVTKVDKTASKVCKR